MFGDYSYTEALGPQLFNVPLVMASAWMALVAYARQMLPAGARIVIAALWMTAIDLVIAPLAGGALGYWRWSEQGAYYGVLSRNFAGWFAASLLIFGVLELLFPRGPSTNSFACHMGMSVILFFTFVASAHSLAPVAVIGVLLCLVHFAAGRLGFEVRKRSTSSGRQRPA